MKKYLGVLVLLFTVGCGSPLGYTKKLIAIKTVECREATFIKLCKAKDSDDNVYQYIEHVSDPVKIKKDCWYKVEANKAHIREVLEEMCK